MAEGAVHRIAVGIGAGAVAGVAGSLAMVLFNHLLGGTGLGHPDEGRHGQEHRLRAQPNDTDGTIADEPSTMKAAAAGARVLTGRDLGRRQRQAWAPVVHHAFGGTIGAVYGLLAGVLPWVTAGRGVVFGAAVWLGAAEVGIPLAGLSRAPREYPPSRHAASLATHLVFGAVLEACRRGIARR